MKVEQIYQVINHSAGENDCETQIELDQDFLNVDFTMLRIVVPNATASSFPVNSRVKVTLELVQ